MRRSLLAMLVLVAAACNGAGDTAPSDEDTAPGADTTGDGMVTPPDSAADVAEDAMPIDAALDLVEDLPPACAPGEGCFGDPCADSGDCPSGLCVGHMGDQVCTVECLEDCPDGWICRQLGTGPDVIFACVSPYTHLCRPCSTSDDCVSPDGVEDVCLVLGSQGSFCGAPCAGAGDCPEGFSCVDAATAEGGASKQCVPVAQICACSGTAMALGLSAACWQENEFGICHGLRTCGPDGLGPCTALEPGEEVCNGVDDDCDGETDEVTCDDGNPCTEDSCETAEGCVHLALTGVECTDGDVCTLADHCVDGLCAGTAINCDDGNPCTTDNCDPAGGCIYGYNSLPCDDGDPCSVGDGCAQGACAGVPIDCECMDDADCLALEDGDVCNGTLYCDLGGLPHKCAIVPGSTVDCEDPSGVDAPCLTATCDPVTGECGFAPDGDGGACHDEDVCTIGDVCDEGECIPGVPFACDDGNPCTDDSCDPSEGCVNTANTAGCDDGNECTLADQCLDGVCLPQSALSCDDGNPCTDDTCEPLSGCAYSQNTAPCDDGNECTVGEACLGGACIGGAAMICNDGNICTDDSCEPMSGCLFGDNSNPCNDGDPCTTIDVCAEGACVGSGEKNCNDGNLCTDDSCEALDGCTHVQNDAPCNDGNPCTVGDQCQAGTCTGAGLLECDDGNPCTDDTCSTETGCVFKVNEAPCSDGDACTLGDVCEDGDCVSAGILACDDGNPCTDDGCDGDTGCQFNPSDAVCDDGNACTVVDICAAGVCVGAEAPDCDDGNLCTDDACAPESGCVHLLNTVPCDDGDLCTLGDACHLGSCTGGEITLPCDDGNPCTDDACDPVAGCTFSPNSLACDDLNACTEGDICAGGVCAATGLLDCGDGEACTDDVCNIVLGCLHPDNTASCDDGDLCTIGDACSAGSCQGGAPLNCADDNVCTDDVCNPQTGCVHTDNTASCDDNNVCTLGDICAAGACQPGAPITCQDGDDCTSDSCDPQAGCTFIAFFPCCGNGIPEAGEQCDDGNEIPGDGCESNCTNTVTATYHFKYLGNASNAFGGSWQSNTVCNASTLNNEYVGYTYDGQLGPSAGAGPHNLYGPVSSYSAGTGFYKFKCVYE